MNHGKAIQTAIIMLCIWGGGVSRASVDENPLRVTSPNGRIALTFSVQDGRVTYQVARDERPVLSRAPLEIQVSGAKHFDCARLEEVRRYRIDDAYPWYGVHSTAQESGAGLTMSALRSDGIVLYTLDARAYDNGVAFRMTLPDGPARVPQETVGFHPLEDSEVWSFDPTDGHYEGVYTKTAAEFLPAGRFMAPPVVIELPGKPIYLAITEGRLQSYPGSVLQSDGNGTFFLRPGNEVPADKALEYFQGDAVAKRLAVPATISGTIATPWRVVMIASTLNELVNNDIVSDVSDPPNAKLFPNGARTSWVKPGRAVWNFLDGGATTPEATKEVSRLAGELGFEYQEVEGYWQDWSESQIKDVVDYSRTQGVGIWLWKNRKDLSTRESRDAFFSLCNRTGVVGVKIDFFDSEAKEVVDLYHAMLQETAEHHLLVNFHGSNKPTGEQRTWPNELTREAIEGMEYCCIKNHADAPRVTHAVTVPFTRLLAGPADYTPVLFDKGLNGTTWANQIASAVILTSPLTTYAANPVTLLANPAVKIIRDIPSVWDETRVLPKSRIGVLAIYARRNGKTWFLACMNGDSPQALTIPADFLGKGSWSMDAVSDGKNGPASVNIQTSTLQPESAIHLDLVPGGGYVAEFTPE